MHTLLIYAYVYLHIQEDKKKYKRSCCYVIIHILVSYSWKKGKIPQVGKDIYLDRKRKRKNRKRKRMVH